MKALDLSCNMIGDKETYNFVRPDYMTGGEAVAKMLEVSTYADYFVWVHFGAPIVQTLMYGHAHVQRHRPFSTPTFESCSGC